MINSRAAVCAGLLAVQCAVCAGDSAEPSKHSLGLRVNAKGELTKDGKPYRGIGVNYFDAFYRTLANPEDTSYRKGFKALSEHGIPFARICGGGYWAADYKLYRENRRLYFRLMDGVVDAAEEYGIGLIPSFFWFVAGVPDLMGEPVSAWGDPGSRTTQFMRRYVREVVTRYRNSPAIWAWEFGNEFSLYADLPNASEHRPHTAPNLGTPATRTEKDDLTYGMIRTAFVEFAKEVRKHHDGRAVVTGNSFPRPTAWHNMTFKNWQQDSLEQFEEMLLADNPDPVDTLCVHMYNDMPERFGRLISYSELVRLTMDISRRAGKPLFIGEFGAQKEDNPDVTRTRFVQMLAAIETHKVPLAAVWVYDYNPQDKVWNITAENDRSWQLAAISDANKRMGASRRLKPKTAQTSDTVQSGQTDAQGEICRRPDIADDRR